MSGDLTVVTPSYHGDFERCRLLCETMDRFCSGVARHVIAVDDEDYTLFSRLAGPHRDIVASSELFPAFRIVGRWRGRWYRWRPGIGLPIYGWHLQQLRKIAVAASQESERAICIDSDICICRPADFAQFAATDRVPLFMRAKALTQDQKNHVKWRANAYAALGLGRAPPLPADDFIGPMITWERDSVRAMIARIEATHHRPWWEVLARQRHISEYLLYGAAVAGDPALSARHEPVSQSPCLTYWVGPPLDEKGIADLVGQLQPGQYALTIQSHTHTPTDTIRRAILV